MVIGDAAYDAAGVRRGEKEGREGERAQARPPMFASRCLAIAR